MILGLMEATDRESLLKNMEKGFKRDFKSSAYSLLIYGNQAQQINHFTNVVSRESAQEYVSSLISSTKPTLGALRPAEQRLFVPTPKREGLICGGAFNQGGREQIALLAIGSSDANYFQPGMAPSSSTSLLMLAL